jgi:hypothetical protein
MPNEYPNQREFTRVPVNCHVEVRSGERSIPCTAMRTLSMNGMFVLTPEQLTIGTEWEINISLIEHEIEIELLGTVVRSYSDGVAFQFTKILGPESYGHLRNLVLYNAADTDQVESEFETHAGIKRKEWDPS